MRNRVLGPLASLLLIGLAHCSASDLASAPSNFNPPSAPTQPPPTGQRWEDVDVTDACGRTSTAWVLVDEICGGIDRPDYLDGFRVPMFRDGAQVEHHLYTVDATHLWVLDVSNALAVRREALIAGLGEPLAIVARGTDLFIASASDGLVIVDASDPVAPNRRNVIPLPGPALDVHVDGENAYVAMGAAGLGVISLAAPGPELSYSVEIPGYAAAVTTRDNLALVAACSTFATVDLTTRTVLGTGWHANAVQDGRLVAPAKDVALVGDTAFVAAGRFGAISIDISDPSHPEVLGNCTEATDPAFYVSGVRTGKDRLYLAAGEWGVRAVDVSVPDQACQVMSQPLIPEGPPEASEDCSSTPPWELLPWEDLWAPPPPRRDPVQTLPVGPWVYAFGDARRIGTRAVDIRDTSDPALPLLGRYDEPRRVVGVAAANGRVLVLGPGGGVFDRDDGVLLKRSGDIPHAQEGRAGRFLADGRAAVLTVQEDGAQLFVDDHAMDLGADPGPIESFDVDGFHLVVPTKTGVRIIETESDSFMFDDIPSGSDANTPAAVAARDGLIYLAAPEWTRARTREWSTFEGLTPHELFDDDEILDAGTWQAGMPRRLLTAFDEGLVELVGFGGHARLVIHRTDVQRLDLPGRDYMGVAMADSYVYLVARDHAHYRSTLLAIALGDDAAEVVSTEVFTGTAMGVAADGDRVYVADADAGIRVYARIEEQLELLGVVVPEDAQ